MYRWIIDDSIIMFIVVLIMVLICVMLVGLFFGIGYVLDPDHLHIDAWIFGKLDVPYSSITDISRSKRSMTENAACLSMDRIEIKCGKNKFYTISPRDPNGFLRAMAVFYPPALNAIKERP